jgi:CDP-diacylglycerol--serine O-phosphatidyltransferase
MMPRHGTGGPSPGSRIRLLRGGAERRASLQKGVYILPNLFTTAGLFLGVYAIIKASQGEFLTAAIAIVVAHLCDGLDGRIARLTNTTSQFGVEYDSLADLVAFGVAPGVLAYRWALEPWGAWGWLATSMFVACGALRLARFNVQTSHVEKRYFIGLPIPAAADMIAATVLVYSFFGGQGATNKHLVLLLLVYGLALLMVSNVRYYSFKDLDLRARLPLYAVVASIVFVMVVVAQPEIMFFLGALTYVGSGPVGLAVKLARSRGRAEAVEERRTGDGTRA